ncbi:TonB-dependent receptor [Chitinophaga pollutisoli]|uniref:TonB-dependent receptor n=1 Tax=Chitinophaga pollutisoli TaxID=3133966 RepID=A0ABZ2YSG8_9BACT
MKLTTILILTASLHVAASKVAGQNVTMRLKDVPIKTVLLKIQKQTGLDFLIDESILESAGRVSLDVKGMPVSSVLKLCLEDKPLSYSISNGRIVVKPRQPEISTAAPAYIKISGVIRDTEGNVLIGASVVVKDTKRGVVTDENGAFTIDADPGATLIISFIGYVTQTVAVSNKTQLDIALEKSPNKLDEAIVVAYGTSSKRKTTSAISTLSMENVAPIPVPSINDAIAGRLAGIIVTTTNGAPGTKSNISIRGGGTPLFVIDNVIRSSNDFANLNPNDIEDYSILKDAAATALYGVAAANGVIVVTTKKGKSGKMNVNYSYNQIFSQPTVFPTKVSSYEQLSWYNKLYEAEGRSPYTQPDDLEKYRTGSDPIRFPNTNWQKVAMKNAAPEMRHDLSVSAGTKLLTYFASLSYYDQASILKTDKNYNRRTTYRLNTVSHFDEINLKVTTGLDGFVETNSQPNHSYGTIYSHIQDKRPQFLAYNEYGLPSVNTPDNPAVELAAGSGYNKNTSRVFNGNLALEYSAHFLEGLRFRFNGNYNSYSSDGKTWDYLVPTYANGSTTPIPGPAPSLSLRSGSGNNMNLQGYVLYNRQFGDHNVEFTGIYEQQQFKSNNLEGSRVKYQIVYDQLVAGPTQDQTLGGGQNESGRAAFIGNVSYNYKTKYILGVSARRDGDDLFVPGKQWGTFYAVSGGYVITEEPFIADFAERAGIDFLKVRGSYGKTGNLDGIARYQYVPGYSINAIGWVINGNAVQSTSEPGSLPSTNFSWQNVKSRNIGIDFAAFNNRLNGSADYHYSRTTGFVNSDPRYAQTLGIGLPPINFAEGATRKEGYEFMANWNGNKGKFSYKLGATLTYFNSLVERNTESEAALKNPYTRSSGTAGNFYGTGYTSLGYYNNNSDLFSGARRISSTNITAGDIRYEDTNGDGQITGDDFRRIGSNTFPRSNFGFTADLGFKGFSLSMVLHGSGKRDRYIGQVVQGGAEGSLFTYAFQQDYWRPDNTGAKFPRAVSTPTFNGNNNYVTSDFWLLSSGFLRLKVVQLGYDLKYSVLKNSRFQTLRVFASGMNLLTTSKSMKYFIDPESDTNNYGYPVQRTISFGINAGF